MRFPSEDKLEKPPLSLRHLEGRDICLTRPAGSQVMPSQLQQSSDDQFKGEDGKLKENQRESRSILLHAGFAEMTVLVEINNMKRMTLGTMVLIEWG